VSSRIVAACPVVSALADVVSAVRRATRLPIIPKLTPNVTSIVADADRLLEEVASEANLARALLKRAHERGVNVALPNYRFAPHVAIEDIVAYLGTATNEPAYSASKGGIFAMMRVMANDFARLNIRVNMVIPGFIDTPMNDFVMRDPVQLKYWSDQVPIGRAGTAEECAAAILWLPSDEASYCIGTALVIDGGQSAI